MCVNIELLLKMYFPLAPALILGGYHNDVVSEQLDFKLTLSDFLHFILIN